MVGFVVVAAAAEAFAFAGMSFTSGAGGDLKVSLLEMEEKSFEVEGCGCAAWMGWSGDSCVSIGSYWRMEVGERAATGEREAVRERAVVMGDCECCGCGCGGWSWDGVASMYPGS